MKNRIYHLKIIPLVGVLMACSTIGLAQSFKIEPIYASPYGDSVCGLETVEYEIKDLDVGAIPDPPDIHPSAPNKSLSYDWTVTNGQCIGIPCSTGATIEVNWFLLCDEGKLECDVHMNYQDSNSNIQSLPVTVNDYTVDIFAMPGAVNITGDAQIECQNTSNRVYSTTDCALEYTWTIPSGWTLVNGQNTHKITVTPNAYTGGTVQVTASNPCLNEYEVKSLIVSRTCPPNKTYPVATSSLPDHTAVNDYILVDPASGWVKVTSGQAKRFKAGDVITLEPKFEVEQGGFFNAKIAPCTDCHAFKRIATESPTEEQSPLQAFVVCPNPSDGHFTVGCKRSYPEDIGNVSVQVLDMHGRSVLKKNILNPTSIDLDISSNPAGIYLVRLESGTDVFIQQIQKY